MDKREKAQNKHLHEHKEHINKLLSGERESVLGTQDLRKKAEVVSDALNNLETCNGLDQFFENEKELQSFSDDKMQEVTRASLNDVKTIDQIQTEEKKKLWELSKFEVLQRPTDTEKFIAQQLLQQENDRIQRLNKVELEALKKFREAQNFLPDEMHDISNKMIKRQKDVAYKQDEYGVNKYNVPLRSSYNYDWLKMATEELVDLGKYLECEMERKAVVKDMLAHAILIKEWSLVQYALNELSKDGTGK